ncbi:hypothetical protein [Shewanella zhangzhouensis]|uniref:hypothetical protein n=1 Tax=Shewanella zhangzhouensis TaxID=2864213 RepID=UPI001C65C2F2|nr:hypothetical protein [Shewanella zhangzhouensis]QYK06022.1 hypothetical protein K0H63_04040 [Shewanella zhangzhouensis]
MRWRLALNLLLLMACSGLNAAQFSGSLHNPKQVIVAGKEVILCELAGIPSCLASLPQEVTAQLPADIPALLGYRAALVTPVSHPAIAGVIVMAPERTPSRESAIVSGALLELPLAEQFTLTLWHEIGHLEVRALQGSVLPDILSVREQEWLADAYLYWRVAKEKGSLTLAWQQFHRRNLQAINDVNQLSHWSSLYLLPLLNRYDAKELALFAEFGAFCQDFYPSLPQWSDEELQEFASLLHNLFQSGNTRNMPHYMYWRKPQLRPVLAPTLGLLMGPNNAHQWLSRQHMLIKG